MHIQVVLWCLFFISVSHCIPTIYKYNENKILEPDLVPVSSTVIPIPVYKVGYGLHVVPSLKDEKVKKPEGPITLVTVHTKKKATQQSKLKSDDVSSVKELNPKDFKN